MRLRVAVCGTRWLPPDTSVDAWRRRHAQSAGERVCSELPALTPLLATACGAVPAAGTLVLARQRIHRERPLARLARRRRCAVRDDVCDGHATTLASATHCRGV